MAGRPRMAEGTRAKDSRVNVSMDASDASDINRIRDKLAIHFGFMPTISQAVQWLVSHGERTIDAANSKKIGRKA
jgi:hypothetical protein